jgi:hypothetical protein
MKNQIETTSRPQPEAVTELIKRTKERIALRRQFAAWLGDNPMPPSGYKSREPGEAEDPALKEWFDEADKLKDQIGMSWLDWSITNTK